VEIVEGSGTVPDSFFSAAKFVSCPSGKVVTGGGAKSLSTLLRMYTSAPSGPSAWGATFVRDSGTAAASFVVFAICAFAAP